MYQNPVLFPQITNRESWSPTIGIYDDDTGEAVNLSNTNGSGTYTTWAVQTSATLFGTVLVTTTSTSSMTIGQGAHALTVATGLTISVGQYVNVMASSDLTNWMQGVITAYNTLTGALAFTVSSVTIQFEVHFARNNSNYGSGYSGYWSVDYGALEASQPVLTASIGDGITIVDTGVIQVYFAESDMRTLDRGTYIVAATMASADGIDVRQLFLGRLPVLDGLVST